jgi:hypothetical protein
MVDARSSGDQGQPRFAILGPASRERRRAMVDVVIWSDIV